ncbi:MAG: hypothetical protein MPW15_22410 [Candidatus Manganitrophus sp.]|nr:hypothetical protein [Candidatus Manganitrophus sp.]
MTQGRPAPAQHESAGMITPSSMARSTPMPPVSRRIADRTFRERRAPCARAISRREGIVSMAITR